LTTSRTGPSGRELRRIWHEVQAHCEDEDLGLGWSFLHVAGGWLVVTPYGATLHPFQGRTDSDDAIRNLLGMIKAIFLKIGEPWSENWSW
jgi:hypothetical protein